MKNARSWLKSGKGWGLAALLAGFCVSGIAQSAAAQQSGNTMIGADIPPYAAPSGLSGSMVIAGSDTMQPLIAKLAGSFRHRFPETKIGVQGGGTEIALLQFIGDHATIRRGDGFYNRGHLVSGHVSILASSRRLTAAEMQDFRGRYGYDVTEIPIAMDAVAIYVNRNNPIQGLTLEQVDAIFGTQRKRGLPGDLTTWGQLGLNGEWAQQPIHLYGRDKQSGTRTFFKQAALLEGELKSTVTEEPGSASEILAISRDQFAMGYVGSGFQTSMVKTVPLAEKAGMPFVPPSVETVANGTYPLGRPLYLYVKKDPKQELEPLILEFLKFVNSRDGQNIVAKAGSYPLPGSQIAKNLEALAQGGLAAAATNVPVN